MKIVEKISNVNERFEKVKSVIEMRQKEVNQLRDELKRLQGEYRILMELGKEQGIIDEEGNIIEE